MLKPKSISCLIVDDEIPSQRVLQHFVAQTDILDLKATCNNALEAFKYLQVEDPIDLIFLDINITKSATSHFYYCISAIRCGRI